MKRELRRLYLLSILQIGRFVFIKSANLLLYMADILNKYVKNCEKKYGFN